MTERSKQILKESIKDFIETGYPITSGRLYDMGNFGIKPAMIRRELSELDDDGFLNQMHTSGGRYPTKKAYQYLVDEILENDTRSNRYKPKRSENILDNLKLGKQKDVTERLADYLEVLSVVYDPFNNGFYNSGLRDLFNGLDFQEKEEVCSIIEDFELLRRRLESNRWWNRNNCWPQVFIGQSPVTESDNLTVIAQKVSLSGTNGVLLLAIGPRRMDYRKSIRLFKYLQDNINHI